MAEVESIDVNVPVTTAYNQWTQFEEFPQFMENVESVTQLGDTHLAGSPRSAASARSGRPRSRTSNRTR